MAEVKNICLEALERHCSSGETGRLDLIHGDHEGRIFTQDHLIVHAQLASLEGVPALFRLLDWGDAETTWQAGISTDQPTLHLPMETASVLYAEHQVELAELATREKERADLELLEPESVSAQAGGPTSILKFYTIFLECSDKSVMPEGFMLSDKDKNSYVIGSDEECDIVLRHPSIEALHCGVILEKGMVTIWDLGANSGVKINGVRIAEERLKVGDMMTLGALDLNVRFQLRRPNLKLKPGAPASVPIPASTGPLPKAPPPPKDIPKGPITFDKVNRQLQGKPEAKPFLQKLGSFFGGKKK